MSLLKQIQAGLKDGTFVCDEQHVRALRIFVRNKNQRYTLEDINALIEQVESKPWPLERAFVVSSLYFLRGLIFRKDGQSRATSMAQRLSVHEQEILRTAETIQLVGYQRSSFSLHPRFHGRHTNTYCIWRVLDARGQYFDYYYVPWQDHYLNPAHTGMFIVGVQLENPHVSPVR